ncbi:MAG: hypothetical protein R2695_12675 [Acidimicrobiales bacterium]
MAGHVRWGDQLHRRPPMGWCICATLNAPTTLSPDIPSYIGSEIGTAPGEVAVGASTRRLPLVDRGSRRSARRGDRRRRPWCSPPPTRSRIYALAGNRRDRLGARCAGGVNSWPAVADDLIVWPIGIGQPPCSPRLAPPVVNPRSG